MEKSCYDLLIVGFKANYQSISLEATDVSHNLSAMPATILWLVCAVASIKRRSATRTPVSGCNLRATTTYKRARCPPSTLFVMRKYWLDALNTVYDVIGFRRICLFLQELDHLLETVYNVQNSTKRRPLEDNGRLVDPLAKCWIRSVYTCVSWHTHFNYNKSICSARQGRHTRPRNVLILVFT